MTPDERAQLLAMPYRIGGRGPAGIDCLGVTLHVLRLHGRTPPDPWRNILASYKCGDVASWHAFGQDWQRVDGSHLQHLDVLLFHRDHSTSAIYADGYVWTAMPDVGVVALDPNRLPHAIDEQWRQTC